MKLEGLHGNRKAEQIIYVPKPQRKAATGGSASPIEDSPWRKAMSTAEGAKISREARFY
jgi:hypothetical protein